MHLATQADAAPPKQSLQVAKSGLKANRDAAAVLCNGHVRSYQLRTCSGGRERQAGHQADQRCSGVRTWTHYQLARSTSGPALSLSSLLCIICLPPLRQRAGQSLQALTLCTSRTTWRSLASKCNCTVLLSTSECPVKHTPREPDLQTKCESAAGVAG